MKVLLSAALLLLFCSCDSMEISAEEDTISSPPPCSACENCDSPETKQEPKPST